MSAVAQNTTEERTQRSPAIVDRELAELARTDLLRVASELQFPATLSPYAGIGGQIGTLNSIKLNAEALTRAYFSVMAQLAVSAQIDCEAECSAEELRSYLNDTLDDVFFDPIEKRRDKLIEEQVENDPRPASERLYGRKPYDGGAGKWL